MFAIAFARRLREQHVDRAQQQVDLGRAMGARRGPEAARAEAPVHDDPRADPYRGERRPHQRVAVEQREHRHQTILRVVAHAVAHRLGLRHRGVMRMDNGFRPAGRTRGV